MNASVIAYNVKAPCIMLEPLLIIAKAPPAYINGESTRIMAKAPRIMLEPPRIMAKAPV